MGTAKINADTVIQLPRDKRNIMNLIMSANLVEYGFLKPRVRTTPQARSSILIPTTLERPRERGRVKRLPQMERASN